MGEERGGSQSKGRVFWIMIVKIHKAERRNIISICDKNLIGKKFEDKDLQLDVSELFYKGQDFSEEKTLEVVKDADSLNIVGEESIRFALKNKLIDETSIIRIKKIPHAIAILK